MYRITDRDTAIRTLKRYLRVLDEGRRVQRSGVYDTGTIEAVMEIQRKAMLPETGVTDRITYDEVYRRYLDAMKLDSPELKDWIFPIKVGDYSEKIRELNTMLSYMTEIYSMHNAVRAGGVFTDGGLSAVRELSEIYLLPSRDDVDGIFLYSLLRDYRAAKAMEKHSYVE